MDISHKGNRAKRCDTHQRAHHASAERSRYARVKDAVSTHRILKRQGAGEYVPPDDMEIIDYTVADTAPGLRPRSGAYRTPLLHDRAAWASHQLAQKSGEGDGRRLSWSEVEERAERPDDDRKVDFPSPEVSANVFYRRGRERPSGPPDNPAVDGELYRLRSTVSGPGMGHLAGDRFGRR